MPRPRGRLRRPTRPSPPSAIRCRLQKPNEWAQRGYNSDGTPQGDLAAARPYIHNALADSLGGANVSYQSFNSGGYEGVNIVGVLPGVGRHSRRRFVLGAHYDSAENPGADDNGSGVAGLLEAARVLGRHRFDATLVFAAFDQEEERDNGWTQGSRVFVQQAAAARAKIRGVIVLDMIGYNDRGDNWALVGRPDDERGTPWAKLSKTMVRALRTYSSLRVAAYGGEDQTDAWRFYEYDYPAVTVIEDIGDDEVLNPFYHTAHDYYFNISGDPQQANGLNYIDLEYMRQIVRGAAAWAAGQAGLVSAR
jgi:Zn-dependent M28 family amino/carboxypeptidase